MRHFKTLVILVVAFLFMLMLAGCIEMRSHVTFNMDGSADVEFVFALDQALIDSKKKSGDISDPFAEMRKALQSEGFTVTDYSENKFMGLRAVKHVEDANEVGLALNALDGEINSTGEAENLLFSQVAGGLTIDKSWFYAKYNLDCTIDTKIPNLEGNNSQDEWGNLEGAMARNMFDFSFAVTFPIKPKTSNAPKVSDEGRTLEWPIDMDSKNHLTAEVVVPNVKNIAITVVGVIILLTILTLITRRKRPLSQEEKQPVSVEGETSEKHATGDGDAEKV